MKRYTTLFFLMLIHAGLLAQHPELVSDIAAFPYESSPGPFCNFDGKLFFAANRYNGSSSNRELFVSDGTTAGTHLFKELVAGNTGSSPDNFIVLNGKMYFTVYNQFTNTAFEIPYVSDGTPEGTFPLSSDPDVAVIGGSSNAARFIFVALGNYVYFQSYEPNFPYNRVLYRTDGTQAGTQIVVAMPNNSNAPNIMRGPMKLGNKLIFTAQVNGVGSDLYSYDPLDGSVSMIRANTQLFNNYGWAEYNNKLYFTGSNLFDIQNMAEPWVSDGTQSGTYEIQNLNTTAGTESAPGSYEVMNGKLFFIARATEDSNAVTLFSIQGLGLPTAVAEIGGPTVTYTHTYLYQSNGKFYFKGENTTNGSEPWQSDGTTLGTGMIKDIWSGTSGTSPHTFLRYCNAIYFTAGIPSGTAQSLYKTDGTAAGTVLVPGLSGSPANYAAGVTHKAVLNDELYFTATYDVNVSSELYRYDGQCSLAVSETERDTISVYPNPSSDGSFTVSGDVKAIAVFDLLGRIIPAQQTGEHTFQIPPKSGVYFIKTDSATTRLLIP
ncbi:T9SS type A sorting domain-containing protein [Flavobacterium sp.]